MPNTFNISDVFISYSRADRQFVERLDIAFKEIRREVWLDWEDIPDSAQWWEEIKAGIEAANTFVFVISPDSVCSKVCSDEINHAVSNHKRLIPILYRDIKGFEQHTHPAISSHQYLFFRETDDFPAAFERLVKALDNEVAYTRVHTRVLVRAREWELRGKEASFLLNGLELQEVREWLLKNIEKEQRLTALQRDYIQASEVEQQHVEQAEKNRQERELALQRRSSNRLRLLVAVMAIFLVIALGLTGLVLENQRSREETEFQSFYRAGNLHFERAEYSQAISEYSRALERRPDFTEIYHKRGVAYYHEDDYEAALDDLRRVRQEQPNNSLVHYEIGLAFTIPGDASHLAIQSLDEAIALDPTFAQAYFARAGLQSEIESAIRDYSHAIEYDPAYTEAYLRRADLYSLEQDPLAIPDYSRALELNPNLSEALIGRSYMHTALGNFDEAESDLDRFFEVVRTFSFQRLPVEIDDIEWTHYFGNTRFAYNIGNDGMQWYRYSQGLHAGLDLGNNSGHPPVVAGVQGTLLRVDTRTYAPYGVWVDMGDFTIIYGHVTSPTELPPGSPIYPDTVLGEIDNGGQNHVHIEVRYKNRWIIDPIIFLSGRTVYPLFHKFPPDNVFFSDETWTRWTTPADQPLIVIGDPIIGPTAR